MKKNPKKNNFFSNLSKKNKILFILGFVLIFTGIVSIMLSFRTEVLDDKYVISDVSNYISKENKKLHSGEIEVVKNTEYIKKGIYKITYIINTKKPKGKDLLDSDSYLTITDELGEGYKFDSKEIIINDKKYDIEKDLSSANNLVSLNYEDNILTIDVSNETITKKQVIELEIKLGDRKTGVKYQTSKECYYSFTPSMDNDFYDKKSYQAYVIEGAGHIKLKNK